MSRMAERLARAEARLKEIEERGNIKIIVPLGADDKPIVIDLRDRENSTLPEWAKQYWPKSKHSRATVKDSARKPSKNSKQSKQQKTTKPSTIPVSSRGRLTGSTRRTDGRGKETNR